ncbi:hypothetical protein [Longispora albida]|uniref:hypothetical protein n=1 Tax=Longispora albida TaxID=203523 RepID=UPI0003A7F2F1|nr:hypothetical protein [Longispora albida]
MAETSERDPLAAALFEFRLDAPSEIVAPGSAAAHRAVGRRRAQGRQRERLPAAGLTTGAGIRNRPGS